METNYKVKHRRILLPLKLVLLLVAVALFGQISFAQDKAVQVANDQQFLQAIENPAVSNIILEGGYYASFGDYMFEGTKVVKGANGNRSQDCVYWIQPNNVCFLTDTIWEWNTANAGTQDLFLCGCCPPANSGSWGPAPDYVQPGTLQIMDPVNLYSVDFRVDAPGAYRLRYTWPAPYNTYVQTEYFFYGPPNVSLEAPDVCGLTTMVNFMIESDFTDPGRNVTWTLNDEPFQGPVVSDDFPLTVDWCGLYKLQVIATPTKCPPDTATIWIDFSCEPVADAGDDVMVCETNCTTLIGNTGLYQTWSTNYAFSWVQISGPAGQTLTFTPADAETTLVCGTGDCWYGEYEVEFQVINGECYDSDTMLLTFYEEPMANAGPDQFLCAELCFTLDATPYIYCSDEINEERYFYWDLVDAPDECIGFDTWNTMVPDPYICITEDELCCPYGEFRFEFVEVNGTCEDRDTVSIFLFEQPTADAGEDSLSVCLYPGECFTIQGFGYQYCSEPTGERYHVYELTGWPAGFDPQLSSWGEAEGAAYFFGVCPVGPCVWGEYEVTLTEYNVNAEGVVLCEDSDVIHFFLFEPPMADAGDDFTMCYTGGCFSMGALPFNYCSDPAPEWGERYGEWTKVAGPASVSFSDPNNPTADACPDEADDCVYGVYTFAWTEYNGDCMDEDFVNVTLFEPPVADAGDAAYYCKDVEEVGDLWHTFAAVPYEYCQTEGLEAYSYWSKCGGPGYVTWYENQDNPQAWVQVSCFGCYCFEYVEVNGDCESRDTIEVCFYEHPYLASEDLVDSACTSLPVCYDLGVLGIEPYQYLDGCHMSYNTQYWTMVAGAGTPTFDPDNMDPGAEVCVDEYGCYSFEFIQYNGDPLCADTVRADLWFFEDPIADAGDDAEVCGPCYMMSAMPYSYVVNECHPAEDATAYWAWFSYIPPTDYCGFPNYYSPCYTIIDIFDPATEICVCPDADPQRDGTYGYGMHYGTYGFVWTEINGTCETSDTVWITFKHVPDPLPISGCVSDASCSTYFGGPSRDLTECGCATCWYPEEGTMTVCSNTCGYFTLFDSYNGYQDPQTGEWIYEWMSPCGMAPIPGYTYEWSFTGPAGSYFEADPFWYDCSCEGWRGNPNVYICFGECCDTARLYLTITSPDGCETTEEWTFYVQHPPDATISGPEIAEVSSIFEYSIPDPANPCYLYVWEVQHCGEIVYGQGTGTIGVHWTDYNVNGGWGIVAVEVYDTCTCCCNVDELLVRVLPQGSLGEGTLSGHVYYNNNFSTPLNGVMLTLWNGGVPIFETYSFNDIEGGNGVGYYAFDGLNTTTEFGLTAEYGAAWGGANATDALAIELKVINPGGYTWNDVQMEAGDVNASTTLSATDALWVKQRAIAMVNFFPAGDWAFAEMSSQAGTYDVFTLNYGDVNRSNIPSSNKDMPAIAIVTDGTINVVPGEVFELPIRVADAVSLGAITLNLGYNSNLLEVVEVMTVDGALSNYTSTNIAMAWSNVNPMVLTNDDAIVSLRLKALEQINSNDKLFTVEIGTEFADPNAVVLEGLTLKTFGISTDPAAVDYFLSYNRPNPFSNSTQIEYTLPETGKVRLSVVDLLGQEIATVVDKTQTAGSYSVQFNAAGLTPGVYIYKITVEGETRDFVETRRMVISH